MLAHGQGKRPARAVNVGSWVPVADALTIARRRPPAARGCVRHRGDAGDPPGTAAAMAGNPSDIAGAGPRHGSAAPVPWSVAATPPSAADSDALAVCTGAEITCVTGEKIDDLGHRAVTVRIVAIIAKAWQAALPVGRQQAKRVPSLGSPRIGNLAAPDHDMVYRVVGETPAHGEASVAGTDHNSCYGAKTTQRTDRAKASVSSQ